MCSLHNGIITENHPVFTYRVSFLFWKVRMAIGMGILNIKEAALQGKWAFCQVLHLGSECVFKMIFGIYENLLPGTQFVVILSIFRS